MSTIRFRAREIDLELHGTESFVTRQLLLLAPMIQDVDTSVLEGAVQRNRETPEPVPEPEPEIVHVEEVAAEPVDAEPASPSGSGDPEAEPEDKLLAFFRSIPPHGRDRQADAALIFSYYLQREEGMTDLGLGDLIRCCIRAGVDTRNFNRALGTLTRRGFLEAVRHGHAYRLSEQGATAVESRL